MPAVALTSPVYLQDPFGPVEPSTLTGPVRAGAGKFGEGLFVEEGTTNLYTRNNPTAVVSGDTGLTFTTGGPFGLGYQSNTKGAASGDFANASSVPNITFASAGTYTVSVWMRCNTPLPGVQQRFKITTDGTFALSTVVSETTPTYTVGVWTRVVHTITVDSGDLTGNFIFRTNGALPAGAVVDIAAVQIEAKTYATSYCSGDLATAWNATGNLLATAAQDFEDGSTASASVTAGTATLSSSSTAPYQGTKSLLATVTATGSLTVLTSPTGTSGAAVTPLKTYSATPRIRPSAGRQLAAVITWYTAAGAVISTSTGTATTGTTNTYTKPAVTAVAPATAAYAAVGFTSTDATNADLYYVDAQRLEEGTGAAAYRWTGAEGNSTSTRATSQVTEPLPAAMQMNAVTIVGWFRAGYTMSVAGAFPTVALLGTSGTDNFLIFGDGSNGRIGANKQVGGTTVGVQITGIGVVPGDLVFCALTYDGTTLTVYASKNGAALLSNSTTSATVPAAASTFHVGSYSNGTQSANGVVDQLVVYPGALTAAEIAVLAQATDEVMYATPSPTQGLLPSITAATGVVRGSVRASTSAGSGFFRTTRTLLGSVRQLTATGSNPDDDASTIGVTLPAGSGVPVGQRFTLNPNVPAQYTVQRVASAGSVYDELYAA